MKKFDDFIDESYLESNHAPLYHFTDLFILDRIIDEDTLKLGNYYNKFDDRQIKMISLTRNKDLNTLTHRQLLNVKLVLDKDKLLTKYNIITYDFFIHNNHETFPKSNLNRKSPVEFEEIILNPIEHLHKYLIEIDIFGDVNYSVGKMYKSLGDYNRKFNIKININDNELFKGSI